ncbi:GtrA family protein [Bosea sp. NBC_00550]|uniref:GtrA family protein n=1 Tax=Bosea sp. NBC_00550 TaxID=2969621 RepID=UPI0022322DBF|nr:GtrA family protein [Bosea sp. NBC_00550]UZF94452.1 GtrA family protein [Bosea sp. NBC_00550]
MLNYLRQLDHLELARQFKRFLFSGALNTAVTYLLFLVLLRFTSYRIAYTVTYACGILIAFIFNSYFVFRREYTVRMGFAVIFTYAVQYLYGIVVLALLVDLSGAPASIAMIVVILTAFPLQFLILRRVVSTLPKKRR